MAHLKNISISEARQLSSPHPFGLVVSRDDKKKVNIMGVSWWTFASSTPPILLVCLGAKSCTNSIIKNRKEFCLCLPDESIKQEAWKCGTTSGRDIDKIQTFKIELLDSKDIDVPVIKESHVAFECRVIQIVEAGDHSIFIGDILNCYADYEKNHLYSVNGYKELTAL